MEFEKNKFNWKELITNNNGKNSGSGFAGLCVVMIGCLAFTASIVGYLLELSITIDFVSQIVIFTGIGATLLGVRKFNGDKG